MDLPIQKMRGRKQQRSPFKISPVLSHTIFVSLIVVVFCLGFSSVAASERKPTKPPNEASTATTRINANNQGRHLQTTNFRATYRASFQHLADPDCGGTPPVVHALCRGNMVPTTLSSNLMRCSSHQSDNGDITWSGLECTVACSTQQECESVYLEREQVEGGTFGTIVFQCEGETVDDVDAIFSYEAGEGGSCGVLADATTSARRNYHVVQMGLECPTSSTDETAKAFLFDDYHFECSAGPTSQAGKYDNRYSCTTGQTCPEGQACPSPMLFDPLTVQADHNNFYECIEELNPDQAPLGTASPLESLTTESPPGQYTVAFSARWQIQLDASYCGSSPIATKRIVCQNSAKLNNVQTLFGNISCVSVDESTVDCQEITAEYFVNAWSGVTYECEGPTLPETIVEYFSEPAFCQTNSLSEKKVGQLLQLGVVCDSEPIRRDDAFFECGPDNDFDFVEQENAYSCQSISKFPSGGPEEPITAPNTVIRTDYRWSQEAPEGCFQFQIAPTGGGVTFDLPGTSSTTAPVASPSRTPSTVAPVAPPSTTPPSAIGGGLGIPVSPTTMPPATSAPETTPILQIPIGTTPPTVTIVPAPTASDTKPPVAPTANSAPATPPPGTSYKVNYIGRFQQVLSPGCEASLPGMAITCIGEIQNVETFNPAISCASESFRLNDGRNAILCETQCTGDDCEAVFQSKNGFYGGAPFGEISWECHGEDVADVDGTFIVVKGEPGFCEGVVVEGGNMGYNLNMAQLAVLCPSPENELTKAFVVDDAHSNCGVTNLAFNINGSYTCYSGKACGEAACNAPFEQVIVNADPHRFPECIQSSNDSPIPDVDLPTQQPRASGVYSARFKTVWYFFLPEDCSGSATPKKITCLNGSIRFIESTVEESSCSRTGDGSIECADLGDTGSLTYECVSIDELPMTHVEYTAGESSCDTFDDQVVERKLQLGVLCSDPGKDELYLYLDLLFECGQDNDFEAVGDNFACLSPPTVIPANADNVLFPIKTTEIMTDYRWPIFAGPTCFDFEESTRKLSERGTSDLEINAFLETPIFGPVNTDEPLRHERRGNFRHQFSNLKKKKNLKESQKSNIAGS